VIASVRLAAVGAAGRRSGGREITQASRRAITQGAKQVVAGGVVVMPSVRDREFFIGVFDYGVLFVWVCWGWDSDFDCCRGCFFACWS